MLLKFWRLSVVVGFGLASVAFSAPFGKVVDIGGHASDVALDERRGVVYVASYTGDEIVVVSTADYSIQRTINVMPQPVALAISPDGRYLVAVHYPPTQPGTPGGITIIDLDANFQRRQALGSPRLAVAFGSDGQAIVLTTSDVRRLDPSSGLTTTLGAYGALAKELPVPFATFPPEISGASLAASPEGSVIRGVAGIGTTVLYLSYDVALRQVRAVSYTTSPALGPRVASVGRNGALQLMGWALLNERGILMAQFPNALGELNVGGHAMDLDRGLIYAEVPEAAKTTASTTPPATTTPATTTPAAPVPLGPPVLQILDADNLTVRERLQLPEHLAGRAVLSGDGNMMYAVSDSGVTILPVGLLSRYPRVVALQEDVLFRGNYCDRRIASQDIDIVDPGGNHTPFSLRAKIPGVTVSPDSGVTPARVHVSVDTSALGSLSGTTAGLIEILSPAAVNIPNPVRVLANNREPDQRGSFFDVPGNLVDIAADPVRDRFYVLRQDNNRVLVFNGTTFDQIAELRTGNTPWQLAVTRDGKNLIVTNDNSQIANVYDLDTLQQTQFVEFPFGHYPRSIAVSGNSILVSSRVVGACHDVSSVDLGSRAAVPLGILGIYKNCVQLDTALAASPSGETIFFAQTDGTTLVYRSSNRTFAASRKDFASLSGAYGAPSDDRFIVDNNIFNRALVQIGSLDSGVGTTSGVAATDGVGLRTASPNTGAAAMIERIDLTSGQATRAVRVSESPVVALKPDRSFVRTLALLTNRRNIVSLTTSGFTALSWNYDAAVAVPVISSVVSAADGSASIAPGGLIRVTGNDLSPDTAASTEVPLSALLGNSCLTANGIPVPMVSVSPGEVVGQLPFEVSGNANLVMKSPGGVSNTFSLNVPTAAPTIFRDGVAGTETGIATVVRAKNNELVTFSNPVHGGDNLVICLTGMGSTAPGVPTGYPGPQDPLAWASIAPDVHLGEVGLPVTFAGMVPGQVGVYQINVSVPWWVPSGHDVPLTVKQADIATTLQVRVIN